MDWSIVHSLNGSLVHRDGIEDPLVAYVQAAEALFLLLVGVLCVFARHEPFAPLRRAAVAAGLSAGLGLLVGHLITEFYDRARPFVAHPDAVHLFARHAADSSFPSDHAIASMAIAVAFLLRKRFLWGVLTIVFAVILDFGRVAAGFHYPTDVLGGTAFGALSALRYGPHRCAGGLTRSLTSSGVCGTGRWTLRSTACQWVRAGTPAESFQATTPPSVRI